MSKKVKNITLFKHSGKVAHRKLGDETLLVPIDIKAGEKHGVYTLNSTATLLWNFLEIERSVEDLAIFVANEFEIDEQTATSDAEVFIEDLISFNALSVLERSL
ncbi:MAG: PqqD family protein [Deltaproteobacteria bacterium]|nr:PqqD family protein [Deltaproteobacteria bacterium]